MHLACKHGHTDIARTLLGNGVDIFRVDNKNRTFLHQAVYSGKEGLLKVLIDYVRKKHGSKKFQELMDREMIVWWWIVQKFYRERPNISKYHTHSGLLVISLKLSNHNYYQNLHF